MTKPFRTCSISGCDGNAAAPGTARGWCGMHYQRWKRSGDPEHVDIVRGAPMEFIDLVALAHTGDDCLPWPFAKDQHGYGQLWFKGSLTGAHRVTCTKAHGKPPSEKHDASHSCGKGHEGCVNPNHLRWDTRSGNFADKNDHGTLAFGEDHVSAKLSDDDVRQIKAMAESVMQKDIAALFGVSRPTISAIVTGKRWAHVQ